jgi:hypothetical protein
MLRPDVVQSGKAGANHIFGDSYRISEGVSCGGAHLVGIHLFIPGTPETAIHKPLSVIFGCKQANNRPVLGRGS